MICRAEYIQQPYSGEYIEKIYDIESPWNSSDWTWIKFTEEDVVWCGEFRGKYRGISFSEKLGIVVGLVSFALFEQITFNIRLSAVSLSFFFILGFILLIRMLKFNDSLKQVTHD